MRAVGEMRAESGIGARGPTPAPLPDYVPLPPAQTPEVEVPFAEAEPEWPASVRGYTEEEIRGWRNKIELRRAQARYASRHQTYLAPALQATRQADDILTAAEAVQARRMRMTPLTPQRVESGMERGKYARGSHAFTPTRLPTYEEDYENL